MQKADCDYHYEFHALTVSAMLQADGIRCTHAESLRRHDSDVLHKSCMIEMTSELKIGSDERRPK